MQSTFTGGFEDRPSALWIRFGEVGGETVIFASGELDMTTVAQMSSALDRACRVDGSRLVADVSDLVFIDAAGLRVLSAAHRRLARQGRAGVVVRGARRAVRRAFELAGSASLLEESPDGDAGQLTRTAASGSGRALESGRRAAGLSLTKMFTDYFALGGTADLAEMAAYLAGDAETLDAHQRDVAAHAVNERLTELGCTEHLLPYAAG